MGNITFFKNMPSREWTPDPYDKDNVQQSCLNYIQMNGNFSELEGRDIKTAYFDDDCNLHIELLNGRKIDIANPCSAKCELQQNLDYSSMFEEGGCCAEEGHFGWLAPEGTDLGDAYNTNANDTFTARTSIEDVLRQIMVSNATPPPVVEYVLKGTFSSKHKDSGEYVEEVQVSNTEGTCSGIVTVTVVYGGKDAWFNSVLFESANSSVTYHNPEVIASVGGFGGITCSEGVSYSVQITVEIEKKEEEEVDVKYAYAMTAINGDWDSSLVVTPAPVLSAPGVKEIILNDNISQVSFDEFTGAHDFNPYYMESTVVDSYNYGQVDDGTYVSALRLPLDKNWNGCMLCYSTVNGPGDWIPIYDLQPISPNGTTLVAQDSDYKYYYFISQAGVNGDNPGDPAWLAINIY